MASLKLNGVDLVYPSGTMALYDITLQTKDREMLVILGGEASGKTSLIRVIAGLEDVSSGEILIGDKDVTEAEPKDRNLALVSATNGLFPTKTVYDNMAYGLVLRKTPRAVIDKRVRIVSEILGLNDVLFKKPKVITAAQRQRAMIGRAMAREPNLYLFDEPLSGLDDKLKAELLNLILNMQTRVEGSCIYATKSVAEALTIGTRIVVMKNGFVQQIDSPANLYDYPANAYVAFLIGSPTINFINKAEIVKTEEGVFVREGSVKLQLPENILNRFKNIDEYANCGKQVIAGLRPEDLHLGGDISATVTAVEEGYAECTADGHIIKVPCGENVVKGAEVKIGADLSKLYLFDAETRLTLLERDEGYTKTDFADADFKPLTFAEEEELKEKFRPKKDEKKKR